MNIEFEYLADRPEDTPLVVLWWYSVWADRMVPNLEKNVEQLAASLSKDDLPIHILAMADGVPVGTAALKLQEVGDLFPDKQYWLGSVYVAEHLRGMKIASKLSLKIVEIAQGWGLPHLYLQTQNLQGGLYTGLGWEPIEQFRFKHEDALLMRKEL